MGVGVEGGVGRNEGELGRAGRREEVERRGKVWK